MWPRSSFLTFLLGVGAMALFLWWALGWFGPDQAGRSNPASEIAIAPPQSGSPATALPPASKPSARATEESGAAEIHAVPAPSEPQKPPLLANQRAEAERFAALREKAEEAPPKSTAEPKLYYRVEVRDAGTLVAGEFVIRLADVAAREADASCKDKAGKTWPCGAAARTALARRIHSRAVTCMQPPGEQKEFRARCKVGGTDLSEWLVRQGWAEPKQKTEVSLAKAAEAARQDRLGIWRAAE